MTDMIDDNAEMAIRMNDSESLKRACAVFDVFIRDRYELVFDRYFIPQVGRCKVINDIVCISMESVLQDPIHGCRITKTLPELWAYSKWLGIQLLEFRTMRPDLFTYISDIVIHTASYGAGYLVSDTGIYPDMVGLPFDKKIIDESLVFHKLNRYLFNMMDTVVNLELTSLMDDQKMVNMSTVHEILANKDSLYRDFHPRPFHEYVAPNVVILNVGNFREFKQVMRGILTHTSKAVGVSLENHREILERAGSWCDVREETYRNYLYTFTLGEFLNDKTGDSEFLVFYMSHTVHMYERENLRWFVESLFHIYNHKMEELYTWRHK